MIKIDFINTKTILLYVAIMGMALVAGAFLKEGIALVFTTFILFSCLTGNLFRTLEAFLIWLSISNFFTGQGYITSEFITKYLAKPAFLVFVIFLAFLSRIPSRMFKARYIVFLTVFLILTVIGSFAQLQSPLVIITLSSYYLLFLVFQARGMKRRQYLKLLNLFVAVAVIQTIVSFLQVAELIPPPETVMQKAGGGTFMWKAGLDDAASGTFGAASSHITSWYAALISLFMLLMWTMTKKNTYLVFMVISFLQFATVDSKIIMGVTVLMLFYTLYYVLKERRRFKVNVSRYLLILVLLSAGGVGFFSLWNIYYEYYGKKTGGDRTDIQSVYQNEAKETIDILFENLPDWGKFKGYQFIYNDMVENEPLQLIWGYGLQGYDSNDKQEYILAKDKPIMQLNNLTNSNSGLISQFAYSGIVGLLLFLLTLYNWYLYNKTKVKNKYDIIKNSLLTVFLLFTFIVSFLYPILIGSIPIIVFGAIISIYSRLSYNYKIYQLIPAESIKEKKLLS